MEPDTSRDEELIALTGALRVLQPAASRLDRDALLFNAGRAAAQGSGMTDQHSSARGSTHWIWPIATAVSLCVALVSIAWRHDGNATVTAEALERITTTSDQHEPRQPIVAAAVPITERPAPTYLLQREQVVAGRFDEFGSATSGSTPVGRPVSRDRLLEELLEETLL